VDAPKARTPDQWADANRKLPPGSAEPGPWRSSRAPYMLDIVRACIKPLYKRVIAVMGSQMGKSAGLLNVIGHRLDDDPAPIIYVGPTRNNIDSVVEPKIMEMFRSAPSLWAKLQKGKKSTKIHKRVAGVSLRLAWAGSATELASDSAVIVLVDEIDRMEDSVKGEGNVFELAEARTSTYPDGKAVGTSTPTEGNIEVFVHPVTGIEHWGVSDMVVSPIWRLWQEGSRHEWAWPCPDCNEYFIPRFKHLWWPEKATPDIARREAKLLCPSCGVLIGDEHKASMNKQGVFIAPGQSVENGKVVGEADTASVDTASFWVSGISNFSSKKTYGYLAKKFLAAARSGESERIQGVINTDFGELFRVGGEAPEWTLVKDRIKPYKIGTVPQGVRLLTAGVDVQKNRLVYTVRGWGARFESWLIEHGEIFGETDKPDVWFELQDLLQASWGGKTILKMAVDSGYQTESVYQFCRNNKALAMATKGQEKLDKPFRASVIEINDRGKKLKKSVVLWHFSADLVKSWVHSRLTWPHDQPGGWWLPENISDDYCKQIVAEARVVKPSGKAVWIKIKKDNHYLDAEALAYLAAKVLLAGREGQIDGQPAQSNKKRRVINKGVTL
jgi:phage terminase large subunit GpA-like protein